MFRFRLIPFACLLLPWIAASMSSCIRIPASPELEHLEVRAKTTPLPTTPGLPPVPGDEPDVLVWMLADNLHTGMVFPYQWLVENGFRPPPGFPRANYVAMSWGNREAYVQRAWLTPWQAVRALCAPSPAVMEMIPFDYDVVEVCHYQRVWKKLVPRNRGPMVAAYLNGCVRHGPDGTPVVVGSSSWGKGVLMESAWHYYIPRVCNVWTAQAIEACGCEVHPWGTMTAGGIIRQAETRRNGFQKIWDAYDKEDEEKPTEGAGSS